MNQETLKKIDFVIHAVIPFVFLAILAYIYFSFVNTSVLDSTQHQLLEIGIVGYFVVELIVKYLLEDSFIEFLQNYWFKIILIAPFARVVSGLRIISFVPYLQKILKIPKTAKITKSVIMLMLFKLSLIDREQDEIEKEKEKIK